MSSNPILAHPAARYRVTLFYEDGNKPMSSEGTYQEVVERLHELLRESGLMAVINDELGGCITASLYEGDRRHAVIELREAW